MDEERDRVVQQVVGQSIGLAFARRGREVQRALEALIETCRAKREESLTFVRLALGTLFALAASTDVLRDLLDDSEQLHTLERLKAELQPRLRVPPAPTSSDRILRRALAELRESIARFNERWLAFLAKLDLGHVNALREGYNRYYLLEKECALSSSRVARYRFEKLEPLRLENLVEMMPLLPLP